MGTIVLSSLHAQRGKGDSMCLAEGRALGGVGVRWFSSFAPAGHWELIPHEPPMTGTTQLCLLSNSVPTVMSPSSQDLGTCVLLGRREEKPILRGWGKVRGHGLLRRWPGLRPVIMLRGKTDYKQL